MKINSIGHPNQSIHAYRIAIFLSSLSVVFGILREFLIVGMLGFSSSNDRLQLYLSIFYTIGLSIDAMRLSCLNLYSVLSLPSILFSASVIGLPFSIIVALIMSYSTGGLDLPLLSITIVGSYLNLLTAMLITYSQRNNLFLTAQLINVMPNLILIPGILICYWYFNTHLLFSIVCLTTLIPIVQCSLLFLLSQKPPQSIANQRISISFIASIATFARHFAAMIGEQWLQIIIRTAFYNYGSGYLSVYAMLIRIYSAVRFILIDSFIGSKLANWHQEINHQTSYLSKMMHSTLAAITIAAIALMISMQSTTILIDVSIKMIIILIFGFYFSTLMRLLYFKINHHENNTSLVLRFAICEIIFAFLAFLLTKQINYPILAILWIGYIAKPLAQLLLLRKSDPGLDLASVKDA
jgi:hypothetical protein